MSVIEDIKNTVDATPFFAAVGATDLAVEKVREARVRADKARADLVVRAEKTRTELSTDLAPANVQARATKAVDDAMEIPALALNQTMIFGGKLTEAYDELAARGHKLVKRIQNQKATKDLVAQADVTVAQVKGAVTSARKATADIERSAKATITTARKEAAKVVTIVGGSVVEETKVVEAEVTKSAKRTRTAAKRTSTTTKNATKKATTSAKGATTSVRKTAAAVEKATEKAADKVGTTTVATPATPAAPASSTTTAGA
jgi:heparin binding hemagglutinin HbhA